jgi:hypothetical protein
VKEESDLPPTPEEEAAAAALRRALDGDADASEDPLLRTARFIAGTAAPPLPELARERVRHKLRAPRPARFPRRAAALTAALAIAASIAVVLFLRPSAPALPYARLFARPFERQERPIQRLQRIIAWRRGELERREERR